MEVSSVEEDRLASPIDPFQRKGISRQEFYRQGVKPDKFLTAVQPFCRLYTRVKAIQLVFGKAYFQYSFHPRIFTHPAGGSQVRQPQCWLQAIINFFEYLMEHVCTARRQPHGQGLPVCSIRITRNRVVASLFSRAYIQILTRKKWLCLQLPGPICQLLEPHQERCCYCPSTEFVCQFLFRLLRAATRRCLLIHEPRASG